VWVFDRVLKRVRINLTTRKAKYIMEYRKKRKKERYRISTLGNRQAIP
jgi:hypothetical protein